MISQHGSSLSTPESSVCGRASLCLQWVDGCSLVCVAFYKKTFHFSELFANKYCLPLKSRCLSFFCGVTSSFGLLHGYAGEEESSSRARVQVQFIALGLQLFLFAMVFFVFTPLVQFHLISGDVPSMQQEIGVKIIIQVIEGI